MDTVDAQIQRAVSGWQIPIMSIPAISAAGKQAAAEGRDVAEAVEKAMVEAGGVKV